MQSVECMFRSSGTVEEGGGKANDAGAELPTHANRSSVGSESRNRLEAFYAPCLNTSIIHPLHRATIGSGCRDLSW